MASDHEGGKAICGIAGLVLTDETLDLIGDKHVALMTKRLGYQMEARGTDATGIARLTRGGGFKVLKEPVPAKTFFKRHDGVATGSRSVIVHTRAKTQGSEKNELNNHPIHYGDVLGIHNGWVLNDGALFRKHNWERKGEVDSEAIFAAIAHLGWRAGLEAIEGTAAVAWYDMATMRLHLARAITQPLWMAETGLGDVVFASTLNAVEEIVDMLPLASGLADTGAFPFEEGQMRTIDLTTGQMDLDTFTPREVFYSSGSTIPSGWTEWRYKGGTSTIQKQGATPSSIMGEPPEFDFQVDDLVWYMPEQEGYRSIMGIITRVGIMRADVQLFLDHDILIDTSLPMDRLELDVDGRVEKTQEVLALEAGDTWEADDVDGVSPQMALAVEFLKAQQEVIANGGE